MSVVEPEPSLHDVWRVQQQIGFSARGICWGVVWMPERRSYALQLYTIQDLTLLFLIMADRRDDPLPHIFLPPARSVYTSHASSLTPNPSRATGCPFAQSTAPPR